MKKSCFETIKIEDGRLLHLKYHQDRLDRTRRELWGFGDKLDLNSLEIKRDFGVLRVDYAKDFEKIIYRDLKDREFKRLKVVESSLEYKYKFTNRDELNSLLVDGYDEVIISKDGVLRDVRIANIALKMNSEWVTPSDCLLRGTTRERLIESGFLKIKRVCVGDLKKIENFAIINSILGFKILENVRIDF